MPTHTNIRSTIAALAAIFWASCGGTTDAADPYRGVVFASDGAVFAFDSRFLPSTDRTTCNPPGVSGVPSCYPVQVGYANGKPVQFYNLDPTLFFSATVNSPPNCNASSSPCTVGALQSRNLPDPSCTAPGATLSTCSCSNGGSCFIPVSVADKKQDLTGGAHADVFPTNCIPNTNYNPQTDPFPRLTQGAVFSALPFAATNTSFFAIVWPVVATYGVTGVGGAACNDLKDSRSIGSTAAPGAFGAVRTDIATSYQMWPVIDSSAFVYPLDPSLSTATKEVVNLGWYKGLQLRYLDGGPIPTRDLPDPADPTRTARTLVVMDAAIENAGGAFSPVTVPKGIVFPAAPGDDAWSPIVRLHNFAVPAGKKIGDYNGICQPGQTGCPASYIPAASIATSSFNTIFVVAPPQQ